MLWVLLLAFRSTGSKIKMETRKKEKCEVCSKESHMIKLQVWAKENVDNNVSVIVKTVIIGKEVIPIKFHLVKIQIHVKGEHLEPNILVDQDT